MGLSQKLTGSATIHNAFYPLAGEIQRLAEREPVAAVRDLIHSIDWRILGCTKPSPSPKAAEMRMKTLTSSLAG